VHIPAETVTDDPAGVELLIGNIFYFIPRAGWRAERGATSPRCTARACHMFSSRS
jgi:hypothetical protein